jgi:hypothetical protein
VEPDIRAENDLTGRGASASGGERVASAGEQPPSDTEEVPR